MMHGTMNILVKYFHEYCLPSGKWRSETSLRAKDLRLFSLHLSGNWRWKVGPTSWLRNRIVWFLYTCLEIKGNPHNFDATTNVFFPQFVTITNMCIMKMYGAEVWQIPNREINMILATEMDVLRRSARKSRLERITNEHIKKWWKWKWIREL